ncbi:hypothetical protein NTE_03398 [Candidatus Nitrososphaera evergladensis SR1]|uniref:Zonular occludens toxin (Zot) n=1 Tax=Candidatus Nitrososphaera evergladensis SR1 TaxID=1459636 RepID=A0A075MUT7_9ARCH|nr:ATP-binding protein [Candidatus Nitrososphaera evergladensis]AIF85426.1 hypothetical protein NTE_03398 [Candidatus Nitrososphaera evergladensis SR1]
MAIDYQDHFNFKWEVGTENSVVIGAHWQGKTHLAANLIARSILGAYPLWAWDYHGKLRKELLSRHLTPQQQALVYHGTCKRVEMIRKGTNFVVPLDLGIRHFDEFCNLVNRQANMHVMIDEAHNYSSAHRILPSYERLVRDKGNQNVSYTAIFQRPAENHKSIISNATHLFIFKLPLHTDVDYLRKWVGAEVELLLQPEFRKFYEKEPELPNRSFIYKDTRASRPVVVRGGLH